MVALLRPILLHRPTRFEKEQLAQWETTPIFRKRGTREPWDRFSYAKAWRAVRRVVPEATHMWLRDLRSVAKTVMVDAKVPALTVDSILGHSTGVKGA